VRRLITRCMVSASLCCALHSALAVEIDPKVPYSEQLERAVIENVQLHDQLERAESMRGTLLVYGIVMTLMVGYLLKKLIEAPQRPAVATRAPSTALTPVQSSAAEPPKTGRVTVTVRDGGSQRIVASGTVATGTKRYGKGSGESSTIIRDQNRGSSETAVAVPTRPTAREASSRTRLAASFTHDSASTIGDLMAEEDAEDAKRPAPRPAAAEATGRPRTVRIDRRSSG
jgi:hypothetical protein